MDEEQEFNVTGFALQKPYEIDQFNQLVNLSTYSGFLL